MKNVCEVSWLLLIFLLVTPLSSPAQDSSSNLSEQAAALLNKQEYDAAIGLLEEPSMNSPSNLELNWLFSVALIEKCERMKASGDRNYRVLIRQPYEIGVRLAKSYSSRPEPYYVIARSLTINHRPQRAFVYAQKAVQLSKPQDKNYPEFQVALGDSLAGILKNTTSSSGSKDQTLYTNAREAYKNARELRKEDPLFVERITRRLATLEEFRF